MGTRTDRAEQLRDALAAALPGDVAVVLDPTDAENAPGTVVLVNPPRLTNGTGPLSDATWSLTVAAPRTRSTWAAWQAVDDVVDALADLVTIDRADPGTLAGPGDPRPAYTLTLDPETVQPTT